MITESVFTNLTDDLTFRNEKFINKKVKVKCKVYGSPYARNSVILSNLTAIPAGSVGKIVQIDSCPELKTEYYVVRFEIEESDASIFAHLNASVFEESF